MLYPKNFASRKRTYPQNVLAEGKFHYPKRLYLETMIQSVTGLK